MALAKGATLEELVRSYFARQGYYVLRSVPLKYEGEDVTDIDIWLYARQAASARIRGIVDVKNKKSPKAFERILWVKGLQEVIGCDRAIIATTDLSPVLSRFAQTQKIAVLSKGFLDKLGKKLDVNERLSLEQVIEKIQRYPAHKQDGDWVGMLGDVKATLVSVGGFPAFNRAMLAFRFFASRAETRIQCSEIAVMCALFSAGVACIALDLAMEQFAFDDANQRYAKLIEGVTYGNERVKKSLDSVLAALAEGVDNGRGLAAKAREQFEQRFVNIRADIVAEHFAREHNSQHLFSAAKIFDEAAHTIGSAVDVALSFDARVILGVFADFVGVNRSVLPVALMEKFESESIQEDFFAKDESADFETAVSDSKVGWSDEEPPLN